MVEMLNRDMERKLNLAYLGGLFDGEGCISLYRRHDKFYRLGCKLHMVNEYIPLLFKEYFGGSAGATKGKLNQRQGWYWIVENKQALSFLKIISPYLRIKQREANVGIEFQEHKSNYPNTGFYLGLPPEEIAYREAKRILMQSIKREGK